MRKDIELIEVKDIAIGFIPENKSIPEQGCGVWFFNLKETPVTNVLVSVNAEGKVDGQIKETASLRFFLKDLPPWSAKKVEVILPETYALRTRYWVSFYEGDRIQEKKFILEPLSIQPQNFENTPIINEPGLLLR